MVHPQNRSGRCIRESQHGRACKDDIRLRKTKFATRTLRELERGLQIIPAPPPLLFVACDPLSPAAPHIRHIQQQREQTVLAIEPSIAPGTEIQRIVAERPTGAAKAATAPPLIQPPRWRLKTRHLPLRSLMVKDVARRELAQRQEARTRDELAVIPGHPGPYRQGREIVAGQESLTGKIPVRIEVAFFPARVDLPKQIQLTECLVLSPPRIVLLVASPGAPQGVLRLHQLPCRRPVQLSPSVERPVELRRRLRNGSFQPGLAEPAGRRKNARIVQEDGTHPLLYACTSICIQSHRSCRVFQQGHVRVFSIHCLFDRPAERKPHLRQPNGMQMRPHKRLVRQVKPGRAHTSRHHVRPSVEKVLIVTVDGTAVCEHQSRLPLPSGSPAALRVVRRRRWDVSQVHEVEVGNIDAQFHRRRADHVGKSPEPIPLLLCITGFPTKPPFAFLPLSRLHNLRRMLPRLHRRQRRGRGAVEPLEERIHRCRHFRVARSARASRVERVRWGRRPVAQTPQQAGRIKLVEPMIFYRLQLDQEALPGKHVQEALHERAVLIAIHAHPLGKETTQFTPRTQAETIHGTVRLPQHHKPVRQPQFASGFIQAPEFVQALLRAPPHLLLRRFLKTAARNGQLASELVQHRPHQRQPVLRGHPRKGHVEGPAAAIRAELLNPPIRRAQQAHILQVRLDQSPTTTQILVEAVLRQLRERIPHPSGCRRSRIQLRVPGNIAQRKTAGPYHRLRDPLEGQLVLLAQCGI